MHLNQNNKVSLMTIGSNRLSQVAVPLVVCALVALTLAFLILPKHALADDLHFVGTANGEQVTGTSPGGSGSFWAGQLNVHDSTTNTDLKAYCIDLNHHLDGSLLYTDAGPTSDPITYILNNAPATPDSPTAAGIQAAIWHYSDGFNLTQASAGATASYNQWVAAALGHSYPIPSITVAAGSAQPVPGPVTVTASVTDQHGANFPDGVTVNFVLPGGGSFAANSTVTSVTRSLSNGTATAQVYDASPTTVPVLVSIEAPSGVKLSPPAGQTSQELVLASPIKKTANTNVSFTKAAPAISTTASRQVVIGAGQIGDTAHLTGGISPTGTITFSLFGPDNASCSGTAVATSTATVNGAGDYASALFTAARAGTYRWIASYGGDGNNSAVSGACGDANESVNVTKAVPAISTTASRQVVIGAGQIGDTAHLTGGVAPSGAITFALFGPDNAACTGTPVTTSTATVNGIGDYSSALFTPAQAGTYQWIASYGGDANNSPLSGACSDANESVSVTKADGTIGTVAAGANLVVGTAGLVGDSATFSSTYHPTGSVVFTLYNSDCSQSTGITGSGPISNTGTASFSSAWTPATAGTYSWKASYAGDANNAAFTSGCTDANEQVTVTNPPASRLPGGTLGAIVGAVQAATTQQPNTGHGDFALSMVLAMVMVLLGLTGLAGQTLFTSMRKEEG